MEFRPIDLARHADVCIRFREDSFVCSFGTAEKFHDADGKGAERYLGLLRQRMIDLPGSCVHAWLGEDIIGQIEVRKSREREAEGYVNLYYLTPEQRGRGFGDALDEYIGRFFTGLGYRSARLSVSPTNARAIRYYRKHGWTDLGLREGRTDVNTMEKRYG